METVKNNEPTFKRGARIGFTVVDLTDGKTRYLEVNSLDVMNTKDGRELPHLTVTDLRTGESDLRMWVDGGIKGKTASLGGPKALVGKSIEIKYLGKKQVEIGDETVNVNDYDLFLLEL